VPTIPPGGRSAFPEEINDDRLIGNALLSNTTACEASRLLLSPTDDSFGTGRLRVFDLMSLIDSAVLHERIFYLPASLPDDVRGLELRNCLVENDVLVPLPKRDDYNLIGQALLASLSTADGLRKIAGVGSQIGTPLSFENYRPKLMGELEPNEPAEQRELPYHIVDVAAGAESFDEAARDLIGWIDYAASGAYENSVGALRAMYYDVFSTTFT
jgi:hypothetical protein